MAECPHDTRTRELIAEARAAKKLAERTAWYHECALRGLLENLEWNMLRQSGLNGVLVEYEGDRFVVDRWIERDDGPTVSGKYINRKGQMSPSWTAEAPAGKVKALGKWTEIKRS